VEIIVDFCNIRGYTQKLTGFAISLDALLIDVENMCCKSTSE